MLSITVIALASSLLLPSDLTALNSLSSEPLCAYQFGTCPEADANVAGNELVADAFTQVDGYEGTEETNSNQPSKPLDRTPSACEVLGNEAKACYEASRDPGEPAVTLTDLAVFRPVAPSLTGDPVGFGLRNAPSNIIATATEQTVSGELFDRPVQVRFVPVGYTFDYGDGAARSSDTGGATWEALGVAQFTPTDTTHAYRERGVYTVAVTVDYAPFVDFGSGWRPVAGTVSATTGGYDIQIVEARTALVERDCLEDPSGVGCPAR